MGDEISFVIKEVIIFLEQSFYQRQKVKTNYLHLNHYSLYLIFKFDFDSKCTLADNLKMILYKR